MNGTLSAPPRIEANGERLVLFVVPDNEERTLVCVTENEEHEQILADVAQHLAETAAPIVLYGRRVEGQWREYITGVDFYFEVIAFQRAEVGSYVIVSTEYGDRFQDMFVGLSWSRFLSTVARTAAKQVF